MINENRVSRYLLYAVGEVALVMIGILLALQVNNWNQNRLERKTERKALIDIKKELLLNKERIETKQRRRLVQLPMLEKFLALVANDSVSYSDYLGMGGIMAGVTNPSFGVVNSLIASGEIKLISNDSLKYFLTDWKDLLGNLYENEQILWERSTNFRNYEAAHIPHKSIEWKDWSRQRLEDNFDQQIKSIEYRNYLVRVRGGMRATTSVCEEILQELDKILRIIDREIKSKS